jgi:isopenicillin-N epimerase
LPSQSLRELFLLDPEITFLNHGSFGACPRPVFEEYQRWQRELERQPVEFLGRRLDDLLLGARCHLAEYLGVPVESLAFVDNATWGINVVIRSLDLDPGDEVLTTTHEYGACTMSWDWLLAKSGASLVQHHIPLPVESPDDVVESLWSAVTERTKAIFLSHITSPTGLILPVEQICERARAYGILTIIDGAHAPGHIPLDLTAMGVDIYAGNLHKWLCAPKGAGFLYVRPEEQGWIESLIISWGWGRDGTLAPSTFVERNQWQGTRDPSAYLSVPAAIQFQADHDWHAVRTECHRLASTTRERLADLTGLAPICPDSSSWYCQMIAFPYPANDPAMLKERLYDEHRIEIPVITWQGETLLRASYQAYNDEQDVNHLLVALSDLL